MDKYIVELTPPAVRAYESIYESATSDLAAGEMNSRDVVLLRLVDEMIDVGIPLRPFDVGIPLCRPLSGVYCFRRGRVFVYYERSIKPHTIVILSISYGPTKAADIEKADAMFTQWLLSRNVQVLPPGIAARAAAN